MRRVFLFLLLGACPSASPTAPMGTPGMPGSYPGVPGAPVPGVPGYPGQVAVPPGYPMPTQPTMPMPMPIAPVMPAGTPVLAPAAAPAPIPPGFRQITGPGFSFAVPATWIDIPPPLPQVVVSARDTTQLGSLYVNANVVTEPFPLGDGQAYAAANVAGLGQSATIVGQTPVSVGGKVGADIEARWTNATPAYRTRQRLTAANGTGYVLTCTADDALFEQARATCNAVLDSFRVLP